MPCAEAYREHIMYTFNGFCKTVIRYAALNAWRDKYFEAPYEEYPITICGQTIILTNGEPAAALFKFRFDEQEV